MKKVLITGAGTGFGHEVAMRLAKKKEFDVIASVEIYAQVQTLKRDAAARGVSLQVEKLDVTNGIEEPTGPDDALGHAAIRRQIAPIRVASGEHCQNRIMLKQFMQARAIDFCQIDSCRLGGVNEILAVLLMAAKFNVPVCPHAGGVGLCEYVQHLSLFDYICVSASLKNRIVEFVDHLHEHFVDPVRMGHGHYMPPSNPGYRIEIRPESLVQDSYPDGPA